MKNLLNQFLKGIKAILGIYSDEVLAEAENNGAQYIVTLMQETSDYNEF